VSGQTSHREAVSRRTVLAGADLRALAVDDEPPALDELCYLLRADARVGSVVTAGDATEALRVLRDDEIDVVFLDIRMPGLDGLELARVLRRFAVPPLVVFVTAHDDRAVDAFDLGAVDYLLKPLRADRLGETLRRVLLARDKAVAERAGPVRAAGGVEPVGPVERPADGEPRPEADEVIPVELAGRTTMLPRSAVRWVEAQGDYARLHTADASHLVRVPLSVLAERWADAGFVRIHRSYLVALPLIRELRLTATGYVVRIGDRELPVSRRHTRELKDRLVRAAKAAWTRS
jgi:DNA-binding LytR/AlgR family response regulator